MRKKWLGIFLVFVLLLTLSACGGSDEETSTDDTANTPATAVEENTAEDTAASEAHATDRIILATTTSTYDSGLLDYILPKFEEESGLTVDVVAVGTGQALAMGASGDADVVLVHARAREDQFVADGNGTQRYDVMYNDFVIVGPEDDPAGIKGLESAAEAFGRIAEAKATFVSRGDDSGTNIKELSIWEAAGLDTDEFDDWYIAAGQGMGAVLTMANELGAYTLSDRATYLARRADEESEALTLEILVEGDPLLFNPYGVIPVNPEKHPGVNAEGAQQFVDWLTSVETQELIASYQRYGQTLFTPDSAAWHEAHPEEEAETTSDAVAPTQASQ